MKKNSHPDLETLMFLIAKLPGLGPKSARRIALYLLKNRDNIMNPLSGALDKVYQNVARCNICGNFKTNKIECNCCLLYTSPSPRDLSTSRMPSSA